MRTKQLTTNQRIRNLKALIQDGEMLGFNKEIIRNWYIQLIALQEEVKKLQNKRKQFNKLYS